MSLPNQFCGLSSYTGSISKCPPNPNAIRAIVFQREGLAVVNGANTEIQVSLQKFFIPVLNAARTSFSLEPTIGITPMAIYKLDLAGLDVNDEVKFLALLPTYGTSNNRSSVCGSTAAATTSESEYMEWCFMKDIDDGELFDMPIIGPSGSSTLSLITSTINKLDFSWGGFLSYTGGTGTLWAATNGGLLKWDGSNATLWNTLNSNSVSDKLTSLEVDQFNSVWISSNKGLSRFSEPTGYTLQLNTTNSGILSDNVNSFKLYAVNKIAVATDSGLSLTNFTGSTWSNFDMYNTPELSYNNIISIEANSNYIFAGTTGGVFVYEHVTDVWNSLPFNSTNTPGWTADDNILSLEILGGDLYVGTSTGLVIVPFMGGTAQTIVSGVTGPGSSYFQSLRIVNYTGVNKLYAGHDNGFSAYDIDNNVWYDTQDGTFNPYFTGKINDILPDFLSGATMAETMFFASGASSYGLAKYEYPSTNFSLVPESNKNANLLLSFPINYAAPQLYSNNQPFYFVFSKNMLPGTSFQAKAQVAAGLTGTGLTVSGGWAWDTTGRIATFTPTQPLNKADSYNLKVTQGSTANDGSFLREKVNVGFYTENIVPILGWNVMGKILIHSGTEGHYTQGLYLRNPQATTTNVIALIGR